jgi:hypothetical protein
MYCMYVCMPSEINFPIEGHVHRSNPYSQLMLQLQLIPNIAILKSDK